MAYSVTLTSKNQITIPAALVRKLDLKKGDKLSVFLTDEGELKLQSMQNLINRYAGSVKVDKHYTDAEIDDMLVEARARYYKKKFAL